MYRLRNGTLYVALLVLIMVAALAGWWLLQADTATYRQNHPPPTLSTCFVGSADYHSAGCDGGAQ